MLSTMDKDNMILLPIAAVLVVLVLSLRTGDSPMLIIGLALSELDGHCFRAF
jgi:hypothetical protein